MGRIQWGEKKFNWGDRPQNLMWGEREGGQRSADLVGQQRGGGKTFFLLLLKVWKSL